MKRKEITEDAKRRTSETLSHGHSSLSVLTEEQVIQIKERLVLGESYNAIAKDYDVKANEIKAIAYKKRWKYTYVDGFEEYYNSLPKGKIIPQEVKQEIYQAIKLEWKPVDIVKTYHVSYDTVKRYKKIVAQDNPVPSRRNTEGATTKLEES